MQALATSDGRANRGGGRAVRAIVAIGSSKSLIQLGCFAQVTTAHTASYGRVAANSLNTTRRSVSHLTEARFRVNKASEARHNLSYPLIFRGER
jgi:hypothetical protein